MANTVLKIEFDWCIISVLYVARTSIPGNGEIRVSKVKNGNKFEVEINGEVKDLKFDTMERAMKWAESIYAADLIFFLESRSNIEELFAETRP